MSKADRLKEEIGWLKVAFGIAVAVEVSVVAWLAQNYEIAKPVVVVGAVLATVLVAAAIVFINRRAFRRMAELENV